MPSRKVNQANLAKHKHLMELQAIQQWQASSPEWAKYQEFLRIQAHNSPSLGDYCRSYYLPGDDPRNVAMRNELFVAFKAGLLYGSVILDEAVEALEADLQGG